MHHSNDIVCVWTGTLAEVQLRHDALSAVGIESKVVGDYLTAGLVPGTVELWVDRSDLSAALAALAGMFQNRHEPHKYPLPDAIPANTSDPGSTERRLVPMHRRLPH